MNYIKMGRATVTFYTHNKPAEIHAAENYRKRKPSLWGEDDLYLLVDEYDTAVTVEASDADKFTVNEVEYQNKTVVTLSESTNEISVVSEGTEYNVTVHLVRQSRTAYEESSSGILYEDGEFFFDEAGFLDGLTSLFASNYEDDCCVISVEGEDQSPAPEAPAHQCCGGGCHLSSLGTDPGPITKEEPAPSYLEQIQQAQDNSPPPPPPPAPTYDSSSSSSSYDSSSSSSSYSSYDSSSSSSSSSYDSSSSFSSYDSGSSSSSSCDSGGW